MDRKSVGGTRELEIPRLSLPGGGHYKVIGASSEGERDLSIFLHPGIIRILIVSKKGSYRLNLCSGYVGTT